MIWESHQEAERILELKKTYEGWISRGSWSGNLEKYWLVSKLCVWLQKSLLCKTGESLEVNSKDFLYQEISAWSHKISGQISQVSSQRFFAVDIVGTRNPWRAASYVYENKISLCVLWKISLRVSSGIIFYNNLVIWVFGGWWKWWRGSNINQLALRSNCLLKLYKFVNRLWGLI